MAERAEPVDVGPGPFAPVGEILLRRGVAFGDEAPEAGGTGLLQRQRRAEVHQHRAAVRADQDVGGLQVAVQKTPGVDERDGIAEPQQQATERDRIQRAAVLAEKRLEIRALDQLEQQKGRRGRVMPLPEPDHARMHERAQHVRLVAQAGRRRGRA